MGKRDDLMSRTPEILVIGGGISGCAVALELAAQGAAVTLVEEDQPGVGATGASAGMLCPQYETHGPDAAFNFAVACKEAYPAFVERIQSLSDWDIGLRTDGMLVVNRTASEEEEARRDLAFQAAVGLEGEILDPEEARRIHGAVATDVHSWLWLPQEAQVDSQRLAVGLADAVQAAGVSLVRSARVTEITHRDHRATGARLADGRELQARCVVLAAGAWSAKIDGLPRELPVRPVRGQMLRLAPSEPLPWTLVCSHAGRYLVPRINGTILVGSTMEEVGYDDRVTEAGREVLAEAAASLIPALENARIIEAWAGLRPISGDGDPVLGPDPDMEGLFYATGQGRNGILYAPLVGRTVADLILKGSTELPWEAFGVRRFDLGG
jgi:glycine oxidase